MGTPININDVRVGDKIKGTNIDQGSVVTREFTVSSIADPDRQGDRNVFFEGGGGSYLWARDWTYELIDRPTPPAFFADAGHTMELIKMPTSGFRLVVNGHVGYFNVRDINSLRDYLNEHYPKTA